MDYKMEITRDGNLYILTVNNVDVRYCFDFSEMLEHIQNDLEPFKVYDDSFDKLCEHYHEEALEEREA